MEQKLEQEKEKLKKELEEQRRQEAQRIEEDQRKIQIIAHNLIETNRSLNRWWW